MMREQHKLSLYPSFTVNPDTLLETLHDKLATCRQWLQDHLKPPYTYASHLAPYAAYQDDLAQFWSVVSHLHAVLDHEPLRKVYPEALRMITAYYIELSHHPMLYQAFEDVYAQEGEGLSESVRAWLQHEIRDFKLAGVHLPEEKKTPLADAMRALSQQMDRFEHNVLAATDAWFFEARSLRQLQGLPEDVIAHAKQEAETQGKEGWLLSLQGPCLQAVMMYAKDMSVRRQCYTKSITRACSQVPEFDNTPLISDILKARHEQAAFLDFPSYAAYSLADKTADSVEAVQTFLEDLAERARPIAAKEWANLQRYAAQKNMPTLQPWDIAYVSEALRKETFALDGHHVRQYFPLPRVLSGFFSVIKRVFSIQFSEVATGVDTWHPHVQVFTLIGPDGLPRGTVFFDLFSRVGKRGGAWMDVCRQRMQRQDGQLQLPMAYVTCNFPPPVKGKPSLLTHDDVLTLFHEGGHALHHVLTTIDVPGVSGLSQVPWDVVEVPSQLLEHWAWQPEVLKQLSQHVETGESLDDETIDRLIASRHFHTGLMTLRQISFALFDLHIHQTSFPLDAASVQATINRIRQEYILTPVADFDRFQHSFSHIFAGGYAAGYFGYLWSQQYASDIFARFEEEGIWDAEVGQSLLANLLSQGGVCDFQHAFETFRGRPVSLDAMCRHTGLAHE